MFDKQEALAIRRRESELERKRVLGHLRDMTSQVPSRSNIMPSIPPSLYQGLWIKILKEHGDDQTEDSNVHATRLELAYFNLHVALTFVGDNVKFVRDYFYDRGLKYLGSELFSTNITDHLTACCFVMIGVYYAHQGETVASDMFMQKVWKYIHHISDNISELSRMDRARHNYLVHSCFFGTSMGNNLIDCQMWVKILLIVSYMDFSYHYPEIPFDDNYVNFIHRIDSDVMSNTHSENLSLDSASRFVNFFQKNERLYVASLLQYAVHGYRIDELMKIDSPSLDYRIKESADSIFNSSILKNITKSPIWHPIVSTAKAHLALFEEAASNYLLRAEIFPKLVRELELLKDVVSSFKYANLDDIINQLSKAIESYEFFEEFNETEVKNGEQENVVFSNFEAQPKKLSKEEAEKYLDVLFF
ncbi:7-keto 8-aminopelargonic acid transporter [Acrasis kona]|uniref:7-keto 8-aminopelargonic acid transporter n=1 Tax=Acrasis kona TaxID=1008807 RepID=A0AAW2Z5N9_9EUKA